MAGQGLHLLNVRHVYQLLGGVIYFALIRLGYLAQLLCRFLAQLLCRFLAQLLCRFACPVNGIHAFPRVYVVNIRLFISIYKPFGHINKNRLSTCTWNCPARRFIPICSSQALQRRHGQSPWAEACKDAGYSGQYQLRDLRKKGLTDEFVSQGENNKGGHQTEAMRRHYRLITPPERSRSTLKSIKKESS